MTISNTAKTVGLALALVFVAATALAQSTGTPRGTIGNSTGPTFPSTADDGPATGSRNPALSPPIAASPADPSPPTVDPNAPNLAIQRGGAGSSPMR